MIELKEYFSVSPAWNQAKAIIANALHDAGFRDWHVTIEPLRNAADDHDEWSVHVDQARKTADFEVPGHVMEHLGFEEIAREMVVRLVAAVETENYNRENSNRRDPEKPNKPRRDQERNDNPRRVKQRKDKPLSPWISPSTFARPSTSPHRVLPDEEARGM